MSYQLVADVLDHAPAQLSPAERLVLVVLAELMPARKPWSVPTRVLQRRTGLGRGLRDVWLRLAEHGCDPRVPLGKDKRGHPFYTVPGQSPTYLLPRFVVPDGCDCESCTKLQLTEGAATTAPSNPQVSEGAALTASGDARTAPDAVTAAPGDARAAPKPDRSSHSLDRGKPASGTARGAARPLRDRAADCIITIIDSDPTKFRWSEEATHDRKVAAALDLAELVIAEAEERGDPITDVRAYLGRIGQAGLVAMWRRALGNGFTSTHDDQVWNVDGTRHEGM